MAIGDKEFKVKNGLIVANTLIYAPLGSSNVAINSNDNSQATLTVNGDIFVQNSTGGLRVGNSSVNVTINSTFIGVRGYTGSQGVIGFTGSLGFTGSQGFTGSRGFDGSQGNQGTTGFTGSQGTTGFTGSVGFVGSLGFTGSQGAGFTGSQGSTGFVGSPGSPGGFTGSPSTVIGFTGSQGAQGFTGSRGFDGSQGFTGSQSPMGPIAITYTFSSNTTNADPGNGLLRLDNANQLLAGTIRADTLDINGVDVSVVLAALANSTNPVKGYIQLQKFSDVTKWVLYTLSAVASPTGYKNLTVTEVSASGANPLTDGDTIVLYFSRTGDFGFTGSQGVIGFTGSTGNQGNQGTTGFTGSQGTTGTTGAVGFTGSQGTTGTTGAVGFTGSKGITGDTGFTGSQGVVGFTGSQGNQGTTGFTGSFSTGTMSLTAVDQVYSGGVLITAFNNGVKAAASTLTPDPGNGPLQYATANGAFTIAAPANDGMFNMLLINGSAAGVITFSGYTQAANSGDPYVTNNAAKFIMSVLRINGTSTYVLKALQ